MSKKTDMTSFISADLILDALDNSLNAFDIVDHQGKFIYVNQAYLKMWGYDSAEEVLGTSPASHCADPETPRIIIETLKDKGECNIEFLARRKDGSTFNVLMWARLAHDSQGNEIYPTSSLDISQRKKLETDLQKAISARDEFISICSHELKTPVTTLKLQFQMAERQLNKGDEAVYSVTSTGKRIKRTNEQLNRMSNLIDEMLDVSRLASGKLHLKKEPLSFKKICDDVLQEFTEEFEVLGIQVNIDFAEDELKISGDPYRLEQVISNLVTNAIKYGQESPISIKLQKEGKNLRFEFSDQGMGIEKENLELVFERYRRMTPSKSISGLGLGLYISREIIHAHDGQIWVESTFGEGSTFIVELPLIS